MNEKCCKTCRFAQVKGQKFECHATPPPVTVVDDADPFKPKVLWPVTKPTDWCRSWAEGTPRP